MCQYAHCPHLFVYFYNYLDCCYIFAFTVMFAGVCVPGHCTTLYQRS